MINMMRTRISSRGVAAGAVVILTAGMITGAGPAHATPAAPAALVGDIAFDLDPIAEHSAGRSYVDLTFRNVASHPVQLSGYAGVSVVAHHDGTQVGRPAVWLQNRRPVRVVLQPGDLTTEIVSIADVSAYGTTARHSVQADGFRVYLPSSRAAAFVPYVFTATTRDVAQLQVDPIGARI